MNSTLLYSIVSVMFNTANIPTSGWWTLLFLAEYIPILTLVPRFILNLRELYARDLQGRCGSNIDTAFGLTSASSHGPVASAIMFSEDGQSEVEEQNEEIQLEEWEVRSGGSDPWSR